MNANPMTEQVAKLVGNLLAGGGTLCLPGVGSLYVERQPARRLDRRHVVPPSRTVQFSSQERGTSLIDEIARVLRVNGEKPADPMPEARKVYDRWLSQVREENTLTIVGVGVLRFKDFKLDEAFDRRLNPQGHEPVRVRAPRRFDAVLWIGVAAVVCVVAFTAWWWFSEQSLREEMQSAVAERSESAPQSVSGTLTANSQGGMDPTAERVVAPADDSLARTSEEPSRPAPDRMQPSAATGGQTSATTSSTASAATPGSVATTSATPVTPAAHPTDPASGAGASSLVSGRNYVVMGVFSTEKNARKAARTVSEKEPAITCGIYRFGSKFMLSPFESDDAEACQLFIRAHAERFPDMWTYTAR